MRWLWRFLTRLWSYVTYWIKWKVNCYCYNEHTPNLCSWCMAHKGYPRWKKDEEDSG